MTAPTSSSAQGLPSDPDADSPSGVVYELPVDRARQDAAPRRDTPSHNAPAQSGGGNGSGGSTSGGSGAAGDTTATSIRSENNFGTSSAVPAAPGEGKRSHRRRGSASGNPVERAAGISAAAAGTTEGPSDGVVFPLLAAVLAVGAGIGVFAGRRALRGRRGE